MSYMSTTSEWSKEVFSAIRSTPTDLAVLVGYVFAAVLAFRFVAMPPPARAVVVTPLLLFVPGYALAAAAYPRRHEGRRTWRLRQTSGGNPGAGLHPIERAGLSFGISLALLPLIGGALWAAFDELSTGIVLFGLTAFTLVAVVVATVHRFRLPASERFRVGLWPQLRRFRGWLVGPSTWRTAVNLFLVVAVTLSAVAFVYAFAVPTTGESYTTAMLVTEQDDEYVASGYPTTFTAGEQQPLTLQLTNDERTATDYTVVAALEVPEEGDAAPPTMVRSELDRFQVTLQPGETVQREHAVAPETVGEDLRLSYYVYKDGAPEMPDAESAYRDLHVWITVEQP